MSENSLDIEKLSFKDIREIIGLYRRNNPFSLSCLSIFGLIGLTNIFGFGGLSPWKTWETCALGFTLVYTGYIYWKGWKKGFFKNIDGGIALLLGIALMALLLVTLASGNELFHLFTFHLNRPLIMVFLVITTALFVTVDFLLFKFLYSSKPEVSKAYRLSLIFSDIPITLAFIILTIYSVILNYQGKLEGMDAFFGGTIAFQMILSNIVWTFTDDEFLENHSQFKKNNDKK